MAINAFSLGPPYVDDKGALVEDVYCLTCSFNLRGLPFIHLVCPRCGNTGDARDVAVPGRIIRWAVRDLESEPAACAFLTWLLVVAVPVALVSKSITISAVALWIAASCIWNWFRAYPAMKAIYKGRPVFRQIVAEYHLAVFLCTAGIPGAWVLYISQDAMSGPWCVIAWAFVGFVAVISFLIGWRVYRAAQRRVFFGRIEEAMPHAQEMMRPYSPLDRSLDSSGAAHCGNGPV